jgi:hypothetical protein
VIDSVRVAIARQRAASSLVTAISVRFRPSTSWKSRAKRSLSSATASFACAARASSISQTSDSIHTETR